MPAHDVPDFMRDHSAALALIEDLQHPRVEYDERPLEPNGHGIRDRSLRHVHVPALRCIERLEHLGIKAIELWTLVRSDANGVGEEKLADAALAEKAHDAAECFIEAWKRT